MNNERYNQIIDEVYENYEKDTPDQHVVGSDYDPMKHTMIWKRKICPLSGYPILERFSKEEFINKCKTDTEFSEKWGLKIEERELSLEERHELALPIWKKEYGPLSDMMVPTNVDNTPFKIPTKLITITYKNEIMEVYE